jgi:hypothetical protein
VLYLVALVAVRVVVQVVRLEVLEQHYKVLLVAHPFSILVVVAEVQEVLEATQVAL